MAFFWKKSKSVEEMIENYMETVDKCMELFLKASKIYMKKGYSDDFFEMDRDVHKAESHADDIRREIELKLYGKALLPESRGDLLGLLESLDRIPGAAESALNLLCLEKPKIPHFLKKYIPDLIDVNLSAYYLVRKAVDAIMDNPRETLYIDKEIDTKESESDKIQQKMLKKLFNSDLPLAEKYQMKFFIGAMGNISDRCQDTSDRMSIIAIKRRI
jgi:uncharacterized protein